VHGTAGNFKTSGGLKDEGRISDFETALSIKLIDFDTGLIVGLVEHPATKHKAVSVSVRSGFFMANLSLFLLSQARL
jgi:hypothetical protein